MKKIAYLIAVLVLLVSSCSKNDEIISGVNENQALGNVSFSLQSTAKKANTAAKNDNTVPTAITISVINENNENVFDNETYTLTNFNGSYLTDNIELSTGNYTLTEFNVLNSDDEVILTAPILGDELSQFTSNPLPINFVVTKNETTNITPPVLWVDVDDIPTALPEVSEGSMLMVSSYTTNEESIQILDSYSNLTNLGDFTFTIGQDIDNYTYLVKINATATGEKNIETFKLDAPNINLRQIISVGDYLVATSFSDIYVLDYTNQSYKKYNYSAISLFNIYSLNNTLYTIFGNQLFKSENLGVSFQLVNGELPFDLFFEEQMIYHNNAIYFLGDKSNTGTGSLYRSSDGGLTFENIADGPFNLDSSLFVTDGGNILIGEYGTVSLFNTTNNTIENTYGNFTDDGAFLSFTVVDGEYRLYYENNIYDSSVFNNIVEPIATGISLNDVITTPDQQQVYGISNYDPSNNFISTIYFNLR